MCVVYMHKSMKKEISLRVSLTEISRRHFLYITVRLAKLCRMYNIYFLIKNVKKNKTKKINVYNLFSLFLSCGLVIY